MRQPILATAALAAVLVSSQAATSRTRSFDGLWSIEVVTESGECDRAYRYPVAVENGRGRNAGPVTFTISGSVAPDGVVTGRIGRGSDGAAVRGRLMEASGRGHWSASGSRTCSGYWVAEKRG